MVFGDLPFAELPGGDEGEESGSLLDRQTVRKNFQAVPFYTPSIAVGRGRRRDGAGDALGRPDQLPGARQGGRRRRALRLRDRPSSRCASRWWCSRRCPASCARATASPRPRWRVVEGAGGAGSAEAASRGSSSTARRRSRSSGSRTARNGSLRLPGAPTPVYDAEGRLTRSDVQFRLGAERSSDGAGDAFEVRLPLRDDRDRVVASALATLAPGSAVALPEPAEPARAGLARRKLLVVVRAGDRRARRGARLPAALPVRLHRAAAVDGARAARAAALPRPAASRGGDAALDRAVADTLDWLPLVRAAERAGRLLAGRRGVGRAHLVGGRVPRRGARGRLHGRRRALAQADSPRSNRRCARTTRASSTASPGRSAPGRCAALARAGKFDAAYGNELARRAQFLDLENVANVVTAFDRAGRADGAGGRAARGRALEGLRSCGSTRAGRSTAACRTRAAARATALLLTSEARTLAEMTRALAGRGRGARRRRSSRCSPTRSIGRGRGDGWGSTNANASAILALAEMLGKGRMEAVAASLTVVGAGASRAARSGAGSPTAFWQSTDGGPASLTLGEHGPRAGGARPVCTRAPSSATCRPLPDRRRRRAATASW